MPNPDFKEFAELLDAEDVEYLAAAATRSRRTAIHAAPATSASGCVGDGRQPRPADAGAADFRLRSAGPAPDSLHRRRRGATRAPPRRAGLLTAIGGVDFDSCWAQGEEVLVEGVCLKLIGLDDFEADQRASGRAKDLDDLESFEPPQTGAGAEAGA